MSTKAFLTVIVMISICGSVATAIQEKSLTLSAVEDRLTRSVEQQHANWKHKTVTPIEGSSDVIIDQWAWEDGDVSVTIARYGNDDRAQKHLQQFVKDMRANASAPEDADEEYSMTNRQNSMAVRKGEYVVYIHVNAKEDKDQKQLLKEAKKLAVKALK
jgi:hypothetical protein